MARSMVPIETISDDICVDLGDSTSRYKFSIMRKLMAGYREINLYVDEVFEVQTAVLAYDNVISLPKNFVYLLKVGIKRNGRVAMMELSDHVQREVLSQEETEEQLNSVWNGDFNGDGFYFYNWYYNGGLGEMYGWGNHKRNRNGYYSIDQGKGEIYIGSLFPEDAEFVIEYKTDGTSDGLTLVPIQYWNCLKYYALSEWYANQNLGLAQYNRAAYEREYNKNKRLNGFRSSLFMADTIQTFYKSSPR